MVFRIEDIKSELTYGGARTSLFKVDITLPQELELAASPTPNSGDKVEVARKFPFLAKSSQIPASTISTQEVPYFGRKIKVAGGRTFEDWTVTVINDEDFTIRHGIEEWMRAINDHRENIRTNLASSQPSSYKGTGVVTQYAKDRVTPIRKYRFEGLWPNSVSTIDVNWDDDNAIQEFQVTWAYDIWVLDPVLNE